MVPKFAGLLGLAAASLQKINAISTATTPDAATFTVASSGPLPTPPEFAKVYTSVTDPNDAVLCGYFATGDRRDIASLTSWLWYDDETTWYLVAPKTCLRVACWNTSGIYVCNDNDVGYLIDRATVGYRAYLIWSSCCPNSQWVWDHYAMAGQDFESSNTNIVVGYADCSHPDDEKPSVYTYPGVNGYCDN